MTRMNAISSVSVACLAGVFALTSCDKAKQLADSGLRKVDELRGKTSSGNSPSGTANQAAAKPSILPKDDGHIAPEWQSQLDRNADGVVFRKDLPFPANLTTRTTTEEVWDVRVFIKSGLGSGSPSLQGVRGSVEETTLHDNQLRYHLVSSDWTPKASAAAAAAPKPNSPSAKADAKSSAKPASPPATPAPAENFAADLAGASLEPFELAFQRKADGWVPARPPTDFRAAAAALQIAEMAGQLPVVYALAPRAMWFGKRRLKPGAVIPVPESQLAMLFDGKSLKGSLNLTFEDIEGVGGHPCGRFAVRGNVSRSGIVQAAGQDVSDELTIESGSLWLSAVQPVILRGDLNIIITRQAPGGVRFQGTLQQRFVRTWTAGKP